MLKIQVSKSQNHDFIKRITFFKGLIKCLSVSPQSIPDVIVIMSALKLFAHKYLNDFCSTINEGQTEKSEKKQKFTSKTWLSDGSKATKS